MKKLLLLLILLNTYIFANSSILIINSYHKGYEWSDSVVKGLEKNLSSKENIDTNILYMDSKRITSNEYYENLKNLYKVQLKNRKYDLVVAIDRFAYDFVLNYYDDFFTNEKILAVGIENYNKDNTLKYNLENKVSALLEKRDLKSNVKLIQKIIPSIKKIYIVNDKSLNAKHTEPLIKELFNESSFSKKLIYLREDDLKSLEKKFEKFHEDSALLFVRFYKNSNGKLNKNKEIAQFIKNAKIPVFITDSIFNKKGALGGNIVDLENFGNKSGLMALDILKTKKTEIKTYEDLYYVFDALKLDQFTLAINHLDHEYKIVNKRMTFYDKNRGFINFVFTISPILILLIIGLIHNIYLRRHTESQLKQRIEFDSVLLNAIESPIFWQDEKGIIIDSNARFCNFLNLSSLEIYGYSLDSFHTNKKAITIHRILEKYKKNSELNSQFEFNISANDKRIYFIKQASYCDSKTKKTGIVTIFTDITKEKEIEEQREKEKEFIIQQSKLAEIGEIFSSIAHQWKSPLVEITTIAQESFYTSNVSISEDESYVKDIMTQVNYMTRTINDFQNFIMPSNEKKVFDVKEAIDSMLEIVNHNIKYNYINISIKVEENTNLDVIGFRNEFMQSILNIINNAKDELIKNDLKNRNINISFYNEKNMLIVKIEDNAGGIKTSNINRIFKPYFSTKQSGHGIGLYMAKMIIEDKMNGKLKVENINNGASFIIALENKK
ncbi:ABC transporter substrate binding protein [Poseidonibacter lekithochrous]|uniref:sensor histidine kinase n=1 Tax=Poseidonibacter lekithochrous TaxID=1904463 RepID=UPI000ABB5238|nr:ABC transporter substrate binding protein [Poseidonibacter lekithochrous]